jgi:CRP/FNR family cyclic AMP-dependent transcriptional regulator
MVSVDELRSCELFADLNDRELERIAAIAYKEAYGPGDLIFIERAQARRLFILFKGRVQVHIQLRSVLEMEPGRVFGWSSLVKQRRVTASARALEPVTVIAIEGDDLNALFDRDAHLGFVVMKQLAEVIASRLRHTRKICQDRRDGCGEDGQDS